MQKKRIAFHTLGCKLNFAETSSISNDLKNHFELVDFSDEADIYVIQSCAVTSTAEKKCRTSIRQANKRNPSARIAVVGCMSQLRAQLVAEMPGVSLVLGNHEKFQLHEMLVNDLENPCKTSVSDIAINNHFFPAFSFGERTRMFVKIQDGCDYFCSYCTVPFARGRSRSDTIENTVRLFREAIEKEHPKEIVLAGVNIGDFGKPHGEELIYLLHELDKLTEVDRIRLSSIEPDLLPDSMIDFVASSQRFMPHFHIPLQSGADTVLRRMNRKYNSSLFRNQVNTIKRLMPFACIAADVITGFPGESQQEFDETFNLINEAPVSYLHVFPYSNRPGTQAASRKDALPPKLITERTRRLLELSDMKKQEFYQQNLGREELVLFESDHSNNFIFGFTSNYIRVKALHNMNLINQIINVKLEKIDNDGVYIYDYKNANNN